MTENWNQELQVKIGSRNLTEKSLEIRLPQYKQIESEIVTMRENAKHYHEGVNARKQSGVKYTWEKTLDREYQKNANNVISILGGRGSGKTSVLLSVKHKLDYNTYDEVEQGKQSERNQGDIILPTILPEIMGVNSDLLGWVLGAFQTIVSELEKELEAEHRNNKALDEFFESCRIKRDNPLRKAYEDVLKQYRYTQKDYSEVMIKEYSGFNEYMESANKILDPQNQLIAKFHTFVETIVETKKKMCRNQPMIFLFIDDMDLSFERCKEVVDVIIRYFSHPDIVTFVAGDMEKFKEVLLLNYLNAMNIIHLIGSKEMEEGSYGERQFKKYQELVNDNLKKILPPSLRYHLKKYPYDQRLEFGYDDKESIKELLQKCFGFTEEEWRLRDAYGVILDKYPRGLMNVYYELYQMSRWIERKEDTGEGVIEREQELLNKRGEFLEKLIMVMIRSSSVLSELEEESIMECIGIVHADYDKTWIDFEKADKIPCSTKVMIILLTFLNFVENIVGILLEHQREIEKAVELSSKAKNQQKKIKDKYSKKVPRKMHGKRIIHNNIMLEEMESNFKFCPNIEDIALELDLYQKLSHDVSFESLKNDKNIENNNISLMLYFTKLQVIFYENHDKKKLAEDLKKIVEEVYETDYDWVMQLFEIIEQNDNVSVSIFAEAEEAFWRDRPKEYRYFMGKVKVKAIDILQIMQNEDDLACFDLGINKIQDELGTDIKPENVILQFRIRIENQEDIDINEYTEKDVEILVNSFVYMIYKNASNYVKKTDLSDYEQLKKIHNYLSKECKIYQIFLEEKYN